MANFCLIPEKADAFLAKLQDGTINPDNLSKMTSQERNKFLGGIVGEENAKEVNALFESKLLLKDQQAGMIRWAEKVAGLKPAAKKDILTKIEKLDRILSTAETEQFLQDLASTKLGVDVSADEAKKILELSTKATELRAKGGREYGNAVLDLQDYLAEAAPSQKENVITTTGGMFKSLQATADLSAPFRQGRDYLGTKEWNEAFGRMFKYAGSNEAYRDLNADIVGHRLYEMADKAKLGLTSLGDSPVKREEQFVSKWAKKMPLIANSERAYSGFLSDLRWNRFVNTVENLEKAGIDVDDKMARELAGVINSATGRGDLGPALSNVRELNEAIWSPKMLKSRFDILNLKAYTTYSKPARVEQWKRLFRLAGTSAAVLGLAKAAGADVETDPRSTDFGKIKIGNKKIDVTGGYAGIVRLVSQLVTGEVKSTKTGEIIPLNTGEFGNRTRGDVIVDFLGGKEAPLIGIINDLVGGKDFDGNDLTVPGAKQRYIATKLLPLISTDLYDAYQEEGPKGLATIGIPALFGVNTQLTPSKDPQTERVFTDVSNLPTATKVTGFPAPKPAPELRPVLDKLKKEDVRFTLPGSSTTIKVPGAQDSRKMTNGELKEYREIYQKTIISNMLQRKDELNSLTGEAYEKRVDAIKRQTTEQSKNELIRHMLK